MTVFHSLQKTIIKLQSVGIEDATLDASLLTAHVLGISRSVLAAWYDRRLSLPQLWRLNRAIRKRVWHVPVAYILGKRDFYRDTFLVRPGCLIPRPDSEHLLYTAEKLISDRSAVHDILDLGTGSGCLLLSARHLFPGATLWGLDVYTDDLMRNIRHLGVNNVHVIKADMRNWNPPGDQQFELIFSNPPYLDETDMTRIQGDVRHEPVRALRGEADGMEYYRVVAQRSISWLRPGGWLILEVDYKWRRVQEIFEAGTWQMIDLVADYGGRERVMVLKKKN